MHTYTDLHIHAAHLMHVHANTFACTCVNARSIPDVCRALYPHIYMYTCWSDALSETTSAAEIAFADLGFTGGAALGLGRFRPQNQASRSRIDRHREPRPFLKEATAGMPASVVTRAVSLCSRGISLSQQPPPTPPPTLVGCTHVNLTLRAA